jgi:hypothetical protein
MKRMSSTDFIATFDELAKSELSEPVFITREGCDQYVLISAAEYGRLASGGDAQTMSDLPDANLDTIEWNR